VTYPFSVRIFFSDRDDFCRAADLGYSFLFDPYYTERSLSRHSKSFPCSGLEDVAAGAARREAKDHIKRNRGRSMAHGTSVTEVFFILRQRLTGQCKEDKSSAMGKEIDVSSKVVVVTGLSMESAKRLPEFSGPRRQSGLRFRACWPSRAARDRVVTPSAHWRSRAMCAPRRNRSRAQSHTHHFNRIDVWINNAGHRSLDQSRSLT